MKKLSAIICIFIFLSVAGYSAYFYLYKTDKLVSKGITGTAEIIGYKQIITFKSNNKESLYYPVAEFKGISGRKVIFTGKSAVGNEKYQIGQKYSIKYDRKKEQNAILYSFLDYYCNILILLGIGLLFLLTGIFLFFSKKSG